jgi:hypothetical protein
MGLKIENFTDDDVGCHFVGPAAWDFTHASASAPACCCAPGAGERPKPGVQAQPTSVSSAIWCAANGEFQNRW